MYPVDVRAGGGFDLKLNKHWAVSPTYFYRRTETIRDRKEFEHRLRFDLTVGNKWKYFSLKDRSRIEYRIRNSRSDSWRYRNKLTLAVPITKDGREVVAPFIAEEVYFDFAAKEFTTNEISAGISKRLSKSTSSEIFWARRDFSSGPFNHVNVIGVNLKVRID